MSEQTQQQEALGMVDTWAKFVRQELPAEIDRLRKKPMSLEQLQSELHSTVMHAVQHLADMLVGMRNDVYDRLAEHDVELESLDDRIDSVETGDSDTQLLPEDAEAIGKLAAAAKLFADEALKATRDEAAVARLQEIVSIADYCAALASEKVLDIAEEELESTQEAVGDDQGEMLAQPR
jgi:hypothetical protein